MSGCAHPEAERESLFTARDYITGDAFEVCHCGGCGFVVTLPAPAGGEIEKYYPPQLLRQRHGPAFSGCSRVVAKCPEQAARARCRTGVAPRSGPGIGRRLRAGTVVARVSRTRVAGGRNGVERIGCGLRARRN